MVSSVALISLNLGLFNLTSCPVFLYDKCGLMGELLVPKSGLAYLPAKE